MTAPEVPSTRLVEAVVTHARDWLARQSPDLPGFSRLDVRGPGVRILIDPYLTPELLEILLWRGLYHFMQLGFGGNGDWIVLTDPHEAAA